MAASSFDTRPMKISIRHFVENFEKLVEYIYDNSRKNVFLKKKWKDLCLKVSHGLILVESLKHDLNTLNNNVAVTNCLFLSQRISQMFGSSCLLMWEIYKLLYTNWLKFLVEPSIIHRGIYPKEKLIADLKTKKVFQDPSQIKSDTHEIARRVARSGTQFDPYISYMLIGILSDVENIVYLSHNGERYVSVEKKYVDPMNKMNFELLGKAIEVLTVWRAQFAHYGDYLFACKDFSSESINAYPNFNDYKVEIIQEMSKQPVQFIKYLDGLFWVLGEVVRIQTESYQSIDTIINY